VCSNRLAAGRLSGRSAFEQAEGIDFGLSLANWSGARLQRDAPENLGAGTANALRIWNSLSNARPNASRARFSSFAEYPLSHRKASPHKELNSPIHQHSTKIIPSFVSRNWSSSAVPPKSHRHRELRHPLSRLLEYERDRRKNAPAQRFSLAGIS
jgi:hypothetical protein